jgi:hypothetical protein
MPIVTVRACAKLLGVLCTRCIKQTTSGEIILVILHYVSLSVLPMERKTGRNAEPVLVT